MGYIAVTKKSLRLLKQAFKFQDFQVYSTRLIVQPRAFDVVVLIF
jgi:hypothetical protein